VDVGLSYPAPTNADDDNDAVLFEKIKSGNYDADDPIWENISAQAKDVVAKLLTVSAVSWWEGGHGHRRGTEQRGQALHHM
jgi:hypothetical protein